MNRPIAVLCAAAALAACGGDPPNQGSTVDNGAAPEPNQAAAAASPPATTIRVHPDHPPYGLVLHERDGVVDSVGVLRGTQPIQMLMPTPGSAPGVERISTPDLDFDGHADLALVTQLLAGTTRSDYWRFDPVSGWYEPLGNHETLGVDTAAEELTTFNRGGHAGRIWRAARLKLMDGELVPTRVEEQVWVDNLQKYVLMVRERRGNTLAEVRRDTLDDGELRAGPSWQAGAKQD